MESTIHFLTAKKTYVLVKCAVKSVNELLGSCVSDCPLRQLIFVKFHTTAT